jgi:hypothetical protein
MEARFETVVDITETVCDKAEWACEITETARLSVTTAAETTLAAWLAALATDSALEAAVETTEAACEAAFATDRAFDAAVETADTFPKRSKFSPSCNIATFGLIACNTGLSNIVAAPELMSRPNGDA